MKNKGHDSDEQLDVNRRRFLNTAAAAGVAGTGMALGMAACSKQEAAAPATAASAGAPVAAAAASAAGPAAATHLKPGELDTYSRPWTCAGRC